MRSAAYALAWEFWSANRRGWLMVLAAIPLCAVVYRLLGRADSSIRRPALTQLHAVRDFLDPRRGFLQLH